MPSIRDFAGNPEVLFSWGRYLYWAELRHRDWWKFMSEKDADAERAIPDWLGRLCYWASSLYVVIEGWERAKFKDPIIDALLGISNHKDLLRKLRNGTFHYQPEIISPKMTEFFQSSDAEAILLWLHFLHEEFCRWLRDWAESPLATQEQSQEWRASCVHLFGWLPPRPAEAKLQELRKKFDDIEAELDASGSTSEPALDLRASLGLYDTAVQKTAESVRKYRREMLAKLGLNPDAYIA